MKFFFLILLLGSQNIFAQSPIGLYEGLMGNSGVAISDSTAPSFYNPSLLRHKNKGSYSLSANTFDQYSDHTQNSEVSATSLTPGYLGSVITGENLNHEFFLANLSPSQLNLKLQSQDTTNTYEHNSQMNLVRIMAGYSFAVKKFPLAFSFFGIYHQQESTTLSESTETSSSLIQTYTSTKANLKDLSAGVSISSHVRFEAYTFGYQYRSRTLKLYQKKEGEAQAYYYNPSTTSLSKITTSIHPSSVSSSGETLIIGHGFKLSSVEILTDTFLEEDESLIHRYTASQSFGLRVSSENEHQFLVGIRQQLGDQIKYIGQATYTSCGYSWKTRQARSAIGLYYYQNRIEQNASKFGFTYSSEISY